MHVISNLTTSSIGRGLLATTSPATAFSLVNLPDLSSLVAPDLYSPHPLAPHDTITDAVSVAGLIFERCVDVPPRQRQELRSDLEGLRLIREPTWPPSQISRPDWSISRRSNIPSSCCVLDVPPGPTPRQILTWRSRFDTAAAYHPWLKVARREDRVSFIRVPPSAVGSGIIARRELEFGVPHGPANELAPKWWPWTSWSRRRATMNCIRRASTFFCPNATGCVWSLRAL